MLSVAIANLPQACHAGMDRLDEAMSSRADRPNRRRAIEMPHKTDYGCEIAAVNDGHGNVTGSLILPTTAAPTAYRPCL
jgi:hypothetical protein